MKRVGFDTRLTLAWAFTLLAFVVLAGGILARAAVGALVVALAVSAFTVWVRCHIFRKGD